MIFGDRFFRHFDTKTSRVFFLFILVFGLFWRLWISWQAVEVLVLKNLPDDAFYYFTLARNLFHTGSISMDGMSVTNGFHPLWLLMITPIFGMAEFGSELAIHIALTLASLIDLASIWLIAHLTASMAKHWQAGLIAAWFYAINPIVILQVSNGLETSIGIFILLLFLTLLRQWLTEQDSRKLSFLVGVAGGLMFLARSDSIFLFVFSLFATFLIGNPKRH